MLPPPQAPRVQVRDRARGVRLLPRRARRGLRPRRHALPRAGRRRGRWRREQDDEEVPPHSRVPSAVELSPQRSRWAAANARLRARR